MRRGSVIALLIALMLASVAGQEHELEHHGPGCHATFRSAGRRS